MGQTACAMTDRTAMLSWPGSSGPRPSSRSRSRQLALDQLRRRRAGVPDEVGHVSKMRPALGLLDQLAEQGLVVPVIVADAGYGRSVSFRIELEERGCSYVMAADPKEIARPVTAGPHQPDYGGLGPPTLSRYRESARPLPGLVEAGALFREVTWRQGSKGVMTSHFAVLEVRPSGKEATRTAQEQAADAAAGTGCCRCGLCWLSSPTQRRSRPDTG
ncbi:transposase [Streptomyces sp. NPDC001270]|uniref:transposase n=1 Tax=Streptomyces sp. NPDC001270 TaxID=3364554 RepID=UPI0036A4D59C